jgi:hypothetical protein
MRTILGGAVVAALAFGGAAAPAQADSNVQCPLLQATLSIVNPLPPGWSAEQQTGSFSGHRVDGAVGSQVLVCEYGAAGSIQRAAPAGEACTRLPNRRFRCITIPPPAPIVVAQGQIVLSDGTSADLDGGGAPDMRLRQGGQLLRVLEPRNGARFSPQGMSTPTFNTCNTAPYSNASIPLVQLPIGVWLCVSTSDGNVARVRVAGIQGIPQLPLPINVVLNYTAWSPPTGGGGGGPLPPAPVYSTGLLEIPQTFVFDLDEGEVGGSGGSADFWFQAATATQLYINPRNGAQIGVGNKTNRGYIGCADEVYSPNRVALNTLAPGNYICAVTSEGRVAQFRINAILGGTSKTLRIGYTTWE